MLSPQAEAVRERLRAFFAELATARDLTLDQARVVADGYTQFTGPVSGVTWTEVKIGDVTGLWSEAAGCDRDRVIQFHHGGGYMFGTAKAYADFTGHLSAITGRRVLSVDYRLAPEHPHPVPVGDTTAAYEWLLAQGVRPENILLAGNSAGAGLSLGTLLNIIGRGLPVPGGVVSMSAMADMELSGSTMTSNATKDIKSQGNGTQTSAKLYVGDGDPRDPLVSPVNGDFTGSCPLYLSAGGDEVFLDDSVRIAERAKAVGVDVVLDIVPGFHHDFQIAAGAVPEADALLGRIADWARKI
jgi:monoterpene epsilon-lactone hydrolase